MAGPQLDLRSSADLMARHRFIEHELFVLTGHWSVEAAVTSPSDGVAEFFSVQSANHGWRLGEWEDRSPTSVDPRPDPDHAGWVEALEQARALGDNRSKLACWAHVLAPVLAGSYRRHLGRAARVADAGAIRWLRMAESDVLDGVAAAGSMLLSSDLGPTDGPEVDVQAVAEVLRTLVVRP